MHLDLESPDQPEIRELIFALDLYLADLYPAESNHLLDLAMLMQPGVLFAVARDHSGIAIGCGAIRLHDDFSWGEVKRMFVPPSQRGRGIGGALLGFLEAAAAKTGCRSLKLETGHTQFEAIRLYQRLGYRACAPFGSYREDPLSLFMVKTLAG